MREPPVDLADDTLRVCLRASYGLAVTGLTFLPLGHDFSAWVYRVQTAEATYFLKIRYRVTNPSSLLVPRLLHDQGVAQVVAPLPTVTETMWAEVNGYALILYPFIEGTTGKDAGMTPDQWITYGAILRQIHGAIPTPELIPLMRQETFIPEGVGMIRDVEAYLHGRTFVDPNVQAVATFWHERHDQINTLVARAEELGQRLARTTPAFVLCHADIHTANVLLDADGQLWIVDWDETMLAPKERDLMFAVGGGISRAMVRPQDEELFLRGYGPTTIDPLALSYYRYAWAVSDIGAYGSESFLRPDLGPASRQEALDRFGTLFMPGSIVALAFESDTDNL